MKTFRSHDLSCKEGNTSKISLNKDSAIQLNPISHRLMDRAMKQSTRKFNKIFFRISKCLACNAEKNITVEDNKKRMNIANFINIYIQIYIPILYVMRMTQNKNDSINSIL